MVTTYKPVEMRKRPPIKAKEPHVKRLFKHMDDKNISIRVVAASSGVDERVISNWRAGTSTPRLDLFAAVCKAAGISIQLELPL